MLYEGAVPLRPATAEEAAAMPVLSTWGLTVISVLAERLSVKHLPLAGQGTSIPAEGSAASRPGKAVPPGAGA